MSCYISKLLNFVDSLKQTELQTVNGRDNQLTLPFPRRKIILAVIHQHSCAAHKRRFLKTHPN